MIRLVPLVLLAGCFMPPSFDHVTAADLPELGKRLPRTFWWGPATAGTQIEGGLTNDWTEFAKGTRPDGTPRIRNNDSPAVACDSWNRFDEDVTALRGLGANMYRMSVEWSRIEPSRGQVDTAALDRYLDMLRTLRSAGIAPMVTLQHFSLPVWAAEAGGFESEQVVADFEAFVRRVAPVLGGEVDWWATLNEPNVYVVFGYINGEYTPGVTDSTRAMVAYRNMLLAHARAAAALRELDTVDADGDGHATRVVITYQPQSFVSATPTPLDQTITTLTEDFFNEVIPRAVTTGRVYLFVPGSPTIDEELPGLKGSVDVMGLQFYRQLVIRAALDTEALSTQSSHAVAGEAYPEGLYEHLMKLTRLGLPVIITENGTVDGATRVESIARHVAAMERAVADGADLRGYLHWTLMDNWEWSQGYSAKWGLYSVDHAGGDLTRRPTPAVDAFRQISVNLGITPR